MTRENFFFNDNLLFKFSLLLLSILKEQHNAIHPSLLPVVPSPLEFPLGRVSSCVIKIFVADISVT